MSIDWTELRRQLLGERQTAAPPPQIKLPMLPTAVLEFGRKADDPQASSGDLGRIIETDSGLTTELLRYANSAATGLRKKAGTAQQAIGLLGIRPTKLFLMSTGVQQAMKSTKSKLVNIQNFWVTNLERALFAKHVAVLLRASPDVAFAASLLQDFLLPALANESFEQYLQFAETPDAVRRNLIDFERDAFGWDHPLATAQVLLAWEFPDDLISAVLLHHGGLAVLSDPELGRTAVAAVAVAALLPDALRQSRDGLRQLLQLQDIWPAFDLRAIADTVDAQLESLTPLAEQHLTLHRRLEQMEGVISH
jgi:HD-like signal output (HDOD) protein